MTTTEAPSGVTDETNTLLAALGVSRDLIAGGALEVRSPITGEVIARVKEAADWAKRDLAKCPEDSPHASVRQKSPPNRSTGALGRPASVASG